MSRDITRVHQIPSLTRPIHLPERRQSIGVDGFWSILLKHRWHKAKDQRTFGIFESRVSQVRQLPHQGCYGWSGRVRHRRTAAGGVVGEVRGAAGTAGSRRSGLHHATEPLERRKGVHDDEGRTGRSTAACRATTPTPVRGWLRSAHGDASTSRSGRGRTRQSCTSYAREARPMNPRRGTTGLKRPFYAFATAIHSEGYIEVCVRSAHQRPDTQRLSTAKPGNVVAPSFSASQERKERCCTERSGNPGCYWQSRAGNLSRLDTPPWQRSPRRMGSPGAPWTGTRPLRI